MLSPIVNIQREFLASRVHAQAKLRQGTKDIAHHFSLMTEAVMAGMGVVVVQVQMSALPPGTSQKACSQSSHWGRQAFVFAGVCCPSCLH